VADTNGDGRPDLIIRNTVTGAVSVLVQGGGSGSPGTKSLDWEIKN
ncbi:MAG: FG-GAP repeat protein, partial [Nitrospirales bacterium]|nr:FG-GAP repeat protein [Nitrospirales bacterium]